MNSNDLNPQFAKLISQTNKQKKKTKLPKNNLQPIKFDFEIYQNDWFDKIKTKQSAKQEQRQSNQQKQQQSLKYCSLDQQRLDEQRYFINEQRYYSLDVQRCCSLDKQRCCSIDKQNNDKNIRIQEKKQRQSIYKKNNKNNSKEPKHHHKINKNSEIEQIQKYNLYVLQSIKSISNDNKELIENRKNQEINEEEQSLLDNVEEKQNEIEYLFHLQQQNQLLTNQFDSFNDNRDHFFNEFYNFHENQFKKNQQDFFEQYPVII